MFLDTCVKSQSRYHSRFSPFIHLSCQSAVCPSVYTSVHVSVCPTYSKYLSIRLSIPDSVHPPSLPYIHQPVEEIVQIVSGETHELDQRVKFVGLCCLVVLHYSLFKAADKKLVRALWDVYKKASML